MLKKWQWKNRAAMVKRGQRMFLAHWRNFCEFEDCHRWFIRELPKYAASWSGVAVVDNSETIEKRFWLDCEKHVVTEVYGLTWEEYTS